MIDTETIARLARELESQQVERKQSLSDKSKIEQAICAFANDLPGTGQSASASESRWHAGPAATTATPSSSSRSSPAISRQS